ncbi:protein OSB1, mitochondrial [Euphorbia lathyris]|uniref:protein OSB1, mitochondrial n=1 Tax=Euphorbia lathyris TaxID=212925 RepID=UPI003313135F
MNKVSRVKFLIRSLPQFSIQRLAFFSSNSAANPRSLNFSTDEDEGEEGDGATSVYQYALRRQRPSTIKWDSQLKNSVSLIGSVINPLTHHKTKGDDFGAYTHINVINSSGEPDRSFRIRVDMWDGIAEMATQHIKRNDVIYVSGYLRSFEDANLITYKVIAKEIRYAVQLGQQASIMKHEELQSKAGKKSEEFVSERANLGENGIETNTSHLQSWQLFFCKPYEWWDKRENKQNSSAPDFKHKHTGECLWLRPDDPPWLRKQLQLLDLEKAEQRQANSRTETGMDGCKNYHHLWQVFFSNPHEWWDNRKNKKHSRAPDFKHKDTGEAIWIRPNDPSWVKTQLQLLDSRIEEQWPGRNQGSKSRVSEWLPND